MSNTAIKFENVSKQYRLGLVSTRTLSHDLNRWWKTSILKQEDPYLKIGDVNDRSKKADSEYVWALRDINFEVKEGDVVGIIGKNGAGKSTLLKILSKVTTPTTGIIKARGRIASLLEVGTGFHPEMTGRENIFMNGAILGMTKQEIAAKLDEIVDFSGVERYLDTPVKRYSSGMIVRLGFSIAAHLDPEILVVDEVLAVGDVEFQKKAIGKMQDVSTGEGRTVLFVSHNMGSIQQLCNKGVLMENGTITYESEINNVINQYLKINTDEVNKKLHDRTVREGTQDAKFIDLNLTFNGVNSNLIQTGSSLDFCFLIESTRHFEDIVVNLSIYKGDGYLVLHTNTRDTSSGNITLEKGKNKICCSFESLPLQVGNYFATISMANEEVFLDRIEHALSFEIIESNLNSDIKLQYKNRGVVIFPNTWKLLD